MGLINKANSANKNTSWVFLTQLYGKILIMHLMHFSSGGYQDLLFLIRVYFKIKTNISLYAVKHPRKFTQKAETSYAKAM